MLGSVKHFARSVEDVGDFSLQLELLVGVAPVGCKRQPLN
jgi:hypothetical protein